MSVLKTIPRTARLSTPVELLLEEGVGHLLVRPHRPRGGLGRRRSPGGGGDRARLALEVLLDVAPAARRRGGGGGGGGGGDLHLPRGEAAAGLVDPALLDQIVGLEQRRRGPAA